MEGPRAAVERMVELMRQGPYHARVDAVDVHPEPVDAPLPPLMVTA
jgi:acylphosphatase